MFLDWKRNFSITFKENKIIYLSRFPVIFFIFPILHIKINHIFLNSQNRIYGSNFYQKLQSWDKPYESSFILRLF